MSKKLILVSFFILLISLSVFGLNYCKTGRDPYTIYYPDGFVVSAIPEDKDCWCNIETGKGVRNVIIDRIFAELVPPADSGRETVQIYSYESESFVPVGTVLNIMNLGGLPSIHSHDSTALLDDPPVVDVVIKQNNDEIAKINNTRNCAHEEQSCYNIIEPHSICTGSSEIQEAYTFLEEGEYVVEIKPYRLNNGDERSAETAATISLTVYEDVERGMNPLPPVNDRAGTLVISNSNPYRVVEVNADSNEIVIIWTLTNVGNESVWLTSLSPFGCTENGKTPKGVGTCAFMHNYTNPFPTLIPAESNARIMEKIAITDFSKIPNTEDFGLSIKYTDPNGGNERELKTTTNNTVKLSYAFSERRKFQIELLAGTPRYCLGEDGQVGGTGKGMAPRVKFDWDWDSWAGLKQEGDEIDASVIGNMMSCDKEGPDDTKFYFCDPTQFTITVMEKLNQIEVVIEKYWEKELIEGKGQGEELVTYFSQFQTYLIGDNYNEDFKQDFTDYYLTGTWQHPPDYFRYRWYKYLENNRLEFVNAKDKTPKIVSGLYNVQIAVTFDDPKVGKFFISDEPTAKVKVILTKSAEYTAPVNPLYFMPFNGNVGLDSANGRDNYGMSYTYNQQEQPLILTEKNQESFELRSGSLNNPLYVVQTDVKNTFREVNQDNRGALLTINVSDATTLLETENNGTIIFSPSKATPVFAGAISDGSEASLYYYITKNGIPLSSPTESGLNTAADFTTYWSGDAATYNCADFEGKNLPLNRADSEHPSTGNNCTGTLSINERLNAFGFNWSGFPAFEPDPKIVLLYTIFYTPDEEAGQYQLHNACSGSINETTSIFLAPTESNAEGIPSDGVWIGVADNRVIPLDYSSLNPTNPNGTKTIQQVFDLIEEERACLTVENTDDKFEMKVWWNPAKLIDETDVWWRNEIKSGAGSFAALNNYLKEEQLQTCGRT